MKILKKLLPLFSALGMTLLVLGLYAFKSDRSTDEGYVSQEPWENLKVLPQNISKDSLTYLMKNYATSLGVQCNFWGYSATIATCPARLIQEN